MLGERSGPRGLESSFPLSLGVRLLLEQLRFRIDRATQRRIEQCYPAASAHEYIICTEDFAYRQTRIHSKTTTTALPPVVLFLSCIACHLSRRHAARKVRFQLYLVEGECIINTHGLICSRVSHSA